MNQTPLNQQHTDAGHPLDPLSAPEIREAVDLLRLAGKVGDGWRFGCIELCEPAKATVKGWRRGEPIERRARVVCWDPRDGLACQATVSLRERSVESWVQLPGVQPSITPDEWHECDQALGADPRVAAALSRRGIDPGTALHDVWAYPGFLVPEAYRGMRVGWTDTWYRAGDGANPYAHPVGGLHCVVDLNRMKLLDLEDGPVVEEPETAGEYAPARLPHLALRQDLRPLDIIQPEGVSFALDGHLLSWQRWSMRIGFNHREGLVLHEVGYAGGDRVRPVAHRLSFAEMVVPYRDPTPDHRRRIAYDIGEWGLGYMTTSLERGCDCLGEIAYLDAVLHDSKGEPYTVSHAICIHEEDNGVLWKHVDAQAGPEVRRMRRLVVSTHVTVANYEYLIYWRFYQDGAIECEVRASGIMVTSHFPAGQQPPYGTLVDQRTYAPFHDHFIIARLDLDIDGEANTVRQSESQLLPKSEDNPNGLGVVQREVTLRTESEGIQDYCWQTQRTWKIVNPGVVNGLGSPVGYRLVPGACIPAMMSPGDPVLARAPVIGHTLWVTPYREAERWPCGEFPTQATRPAGLPVWTRGDRPIADTDVVLWYVFGIHHVPRPEDWPVMPAETVSFWLKPAGFFDRNPALDVAPSSSC